MFLSNSQREREGLVTACSWQSVCQQRSTALLLQEQWGGVSRSSTDRDVSKKKVSVASSGTGWRRGRRPVLEAAVARLCGVTPHNGQFSDLSEFIDPSEKEDHFSGFLADPKKRPSPDFENAPKMGNYFLMFTFFLNSSSYSLCALKLAFLKHFFCKLFQIMLFASSFWILLQGGFFGRNFQQKNPKLHSPRKKKQTPPSEDFQMPTQKKRDPAPYFGGKWVMGS